MAIGQDLLNVPMGDMIRQMAFAIADAQFELDESSMHVAEMMSGRRVVRDAEGEVEMEGDELKFIDTRVFFGYDLEPDTGTSPPTLKKQPALVSMLELGFTPVFYQFIETIIEVKIAITITMTQETSFTQTGSTTGRSFQRRGFLPGRSSIGVATNQVNATYSSKYSYTAEGSSLLRTKMVPVPPPAILEERIRALLEQNKTEQTDSTTREVAT